jgi:hypothetical protein
MKALMSICLALTLASVSMDTLARGRGGHGSGHRHHYSGYSSGGYSGASAVGAYHTGPRGGCYIITASGRKRYVDRSLCR